MQDVTSQLLGVIGRQTKTGRAVWDVQLADQAVNGGKFSTFEPNIAGKASQFANQMVTLRYEVKQNGRWTNYDVIDVTPAGQMPAVVPGVVPVTAPPGAGGQQQYTPPPITQGSSSGGGSGQYPPQVETRITKLATLEIAGSIIGKSLEGGGLPDDLEGVVNAVDFLARRFYISARSHEQQAVAAQQPTTPAAVAQAVNAEMPDAVTVGAQPTPQEAAASDVQWN